MTPNIEAATLELQQMQSEYDMLERLLSDPFDDGEPWPQFEIDCMLIRMLVLKNGIKYLTGLITRELEELPITQFLTPTNNEQSNRTEH